MGGPSLESLEKLVGTPRDGALLRHSLGLEFLRLKNFAKAIEHLRHAVERDPGYSAAWRALGKALEADGRAEAALAAYRDGIAGAHRLRVGADRRGRVLGLDRSLHMGVS